MAKRIGIIGGMGVFAGLDVNEKIYKNMKVQSEQEYPDVILVSISKIKDRTSYLHKNDIENPGELIFENIKKLNLFNVELVGISCNTAHSDEIMSLIEDRIKENNLNVKIIHLIEETYNFTKKNYPNLKKIGLMATKGTYKSKIYSKYFNKDYEIIYPDEEIIDEIHSLIYNHIYGIKLAENKLNEFSLEKFNKSVENLKSKGAEAIILGCTEIPIITNFVKTENILIDPNDILAKALIRESLYN